MNKRGFTLIEIMIVITILGIIVAIAIPRLMDTDKSPKKMNPLQSEQKEPEESFVKQFSIKTNKKYRVIILDENGNREEKVFIVEGVE